MRGNLLEDLGEDFFLEKERHVGKAGLFSSLDIVLLGSGNHSCSSPLATKTEWRMTKIRTAEVKDKRNSDFFILALYF